MFKLQKLTCENCNSNEIVLRNGYYTCKNCGTKYIMTITEDEDESEEKEVVRVLNNENLYEPSKFEKVFGKIKPYTQKNRNSYSIKEIKEYGMSPLTIRLICVFIWTILTIFSYYLAIKEGEDSLFIIIFGIIFWAALILIIFLSIINKGALFYGLKNLNLPIEYGTYKQVDVLEYAAVIKIDNKTELLVNWEEGKYQLYCKDRFTQIMNKNDIKNFQIDVSENYGTGYNYQLSVTFTASTNTPFILRRSFNSEGHYHSNAYEAIMFLRKWLIKESEDL